MKAVTGGARAGDEGARSSVLLFASMARATRLDVWHQNVRRLLRLCGVVAGLTGRECRAMFRMVEARAGHPGIGARNLRDRPRAARRLRASYFMAFIAHTPLEQIPRHRTRSRASKPKQPLAIRSRQRDRRKVDDAARLRRAKSIRITREVLRAVILHQRRHHAPRITVRHRAIRIRGIDVEPVTTRAMLLHTTGLHAPSTGLRLMTVTTLQDDGPDSRLDALRIMLNTASEVQIFIVRARVNI